MLSAGAEGLLVGPAGLAAQQPRPHHLELGVDDVDRRLELFEVKRLAAPVEIGY